MSKPVIIENPILNSLFEEPSKHFKLTEDGITSEAIGTSAYFIPVPLSPKKSQHYTLFDSEWRQYHIRFRECQRYARE